MFMKKIVEELQAYLVTANPDHIDNIQEAATAERTEPKLCRALIELPMSTEVVTTRIETDGLLRLSHVKYLVKGDEDNFEVNKLVRCKALDQPEDSIILMIVAASDDDEIVLVPVSA